LDNNCCLNTQIETVPAHLDAAVENWNLHLSLDAHAPFTQFENKCFFVDRFKKPGPKPTMHLDGTADDLPCQLLVLEHEVAPFTTSSILGFLASCFPDFLSGANWISWRSDLHQHARGV